MKRVAVVGAGLSGLATAFELLESGGSVDVTVLEASSRCGGLLQTRREDGFLLEASADSISLNKPEAFELARRLGLADELMPINPAGRRSYLWLDGCFEPFSPVSLLAPPLDTDAFLSGAILSERGRRRLTAEPDVPVATADDESVADFVTRRFGPEFLDRVAGPLVNGVYGAEPSELGAAATLPALYTLERERGWVSEPGLERVPARSGFVSLQGGIQRLTDALTAAVAARVDLRLKAPVERVGPSSGGWRLHQGGQSREFDAVALCTPAPEAARVLAPELSELAASLEGIRYSPAIIVAMAFDRPPPLPDDCAGFLLPQSDPSPLMACSWTSNKFAGRAPEGHQLVRVFLRPSRVSDLDKDGAGQLAKAQLVERFGFPDPLLTRVFDWKKGLPRYDTGHPRRIAAIEAALQDWPALALAGNYFDGVGLSDCVRRARSAARQLG